MGKYLPDDIDLIKYHGTFACEFHLVVEKDVNVLIRFLV
jgi:hypothetical protein